MNELIRIVLLLMRSLRQYLGLASSNVTSKRFVASRGSMMLPMMLTCVSSCLWNFFQTTGLSNMSNCSVTNSHEMSSVWPWFRTNTCSSVSREINAAAKRKKIKSAPVNACCRAGEHPTPNRRRRRPKTHSADTAYAASLKALHNFRVSGHDVISSFLTH